MSIADAREINITVPRKKFNRVYLPHLNSMQRTQIFFGGASSGKSVFLAQRAVIDLIAGERNYLIARAIARTIKKSVFAEVEGVISDWKLTPLFDINKSDMTITCLDTECQALFVGLDNVEKIKSIRPKKGAITDVWVEEATETDAKSLKQLRKRQRGGSATIPKRFTLSFNPILKDHHLYREYFESRGWADDQTIYEDGALLILKTTYKDNRFLTDQDRFDLETETDEYFRDVYTLGKWGVMGAVIFKNWKVEDLSGMRAQFVNTRNGGDFGFSVDPAAMIRTHYEAKKKTIYIFDEFYETECTNDMLATEALKMFGNETIVWDSSEPKSIAELVGYGVNAVAAKKGPDSVNHGIQWLQGQTIIVDVSCIHTQTEMSSYKWKEGADGKPVSPPVPVDRKNHLIDGLRYAYEDDMIIRPVRKGRQWNG